MARVYNFSAGPSMLPESVLQKAASEMLDYQNTGESVMEMSHRSAEYEQIIDDCQARLRRVLCIPQNYKVLFLQGGASTQFAAVPLNLLRTGKADYVVTGQFSGKAYEEACRYGDIRLAATSKDRGFAYIPALSRSDFRPDADYVHICMNNTIFGTLWQELPDTGEIPLVADISSCILSEPIDVSRFGLLYAGAQKNMAPAGLTVVIVREDLLGHAAASCPTMLDYKTMAENDSMYNTPPTYAIYICQLVLDWIENEIGGLGKMGAQNRRKAALLYDFLDRSKLFKGSADRAFRSIMNATFVTGEEQLDKLFVKEATAQGFINLKGHRAVGGMRASIYNAMPEEGVRRLVTMMETFEQAHAR